MCDWLIVGIAITGPTIDGNFSTAVVLPDYSFVTEVGDGNLIAHCVTGMGPASGGNGQLGEWYFDGTRIPNGVCNNRVVQPRGAPIMDFIGVLHLNQCRAFTTDAEGVYSCMIADSAAVMQTMRLGVYFNGRSESLDMYPIHHLIVNHLSSLYNSCSNDRPSTIIYCNSCCWFIPHIVLYLTRFSPRHIHMDEG